MSKKTNNIITSQEWQENLKSCINCAFEETCETPLPFPICLDECCESHKKVNNE